MELNQQCENKVNELQTQLNELQKNNQITIQVIHQLDIERENLSTKQQEQQKELLECRKIYFNYLCKEFGLKEEDHNRFYEYCLKLPPQQWKQFVIENK
ncbi:hypothetical protein ENUP19_0100G0018 [Entamoeba nuttalli]|uniref:Uncharacterized protein n=2 Tax=Entamoeba nuttalli TaxID=412467 RepID=K2HQM7_ENTNP|nr:hypothetical protein ENU1_172620 [Entamoeba nuttalli P19]EKE38230.1 hypothetical protein ENU1_172620 [Entamoeba nuttalli P19]|eukprot:XP_008859425.1 hypothetical protein ENU1_172620 [Entamoeba nuttalli P19]